MSLLVTVQAVSARVLLALVLVPVYRVLAPALEEVRVKL